MRSRPNLTPRSSRAAPGSTNLTAGTVGAYIGDGTTTVTYTNVDPPASAGTGSSAASTGPQPAVTAAPTTPTQAPAAAAPTRAAVAARVVSVSIVTVHGTRYVSIRIASPNAKASVHLRLLDKHGTVLRNAVRTVRANVTTRIL